nr:DUF6715 family protein [uncultured Tyzzerella sp.]
MPNKNDTKLKTNVKIDGTSKTRPVNTNTKPRSQRAKETEKGINNVRPTNANVNRKPSQPNVNVNKKPSQQPNVNKKNDAKNKDNNKPENKKNNKGNNIIGILFIILISLIVLAFIGFSILKSGNTSGYFNKEDRVAAKAIYDKIISISEENYPQTPEDVVKVYTEGYKLLYGDKIKDLSIVPNIIEKQRLLFSEKLLDKNPLEEQINGVLASIQNLKNNKIKITSINVKPTTYDQRDNTLAYVKVDKKDSFFQTYYYIYHLKLEEGKWKITGWYNTDENYNIIEQ